MDQEQQPRQSSFIRELVPDWRPTRGQVLRTVRITIVVVVVLLAVLLLLYGISRVFVIELMDLLKVLALPITVGAAVPLLNWLQKKRELDVENQRAQDETLQAYLDQISKLLLDKERPLQPAQEGDEVQGAEVRTVARARTLTVLSRLGSDRKRSVVQFLSEAGLIITPQPAVNLREADLREADLMEALLPQAHLIEANLAHAKLERADLEASNLRKADLRFARLVRAELGNANLSDTNLENTDLRGATLDSTLLIDAELRDANLADAYLAFAELSNAALNGATLNGANFSNATLTGANLSGAKGLTNEELEQQAASLEGATMPNGQKYEDWLKSKGRVEGGKNDGS
jgi:uncharacterized protein YjbI with pentapeptide repeats